METTPQERSILETGQNGRGYGRGARTDEGRSDMLGAKVGLHQGLAPGPFLLLR